MAAVIYRGPKRGYKLSDIDVLWLARAFVGEAGENLNQEEAGALFHCWMDRLHLWNAIWSQEGWDLHQLIRAHSQPVNPLWLDPDGSKCQQHPEACTRAKLARRRHIQSLTEAQLRSMGVWQLAEAAQDGTLPRPISDPIYDFASCSLTGRQNRPCPGINIGGNCFLTYDCLKPGEKERVIAGAVVQDMPVEEVAKKGIPAILALPVGYFLYRLGEWLYDNVFSKREGK